MKEVATYMKTDTPKLIIAEEPYAAYGSPEFIQRIRIGVPRKKVMQVQAQLGITQQQMAGLLHISGRTLQRHADTELLDAPTSEKVLMLAELQRLGVEVLGSEKEFTGWLQEEVPSLNGRKPVSYLDTYSGIDIVRQVLYRIAYGIF